MTVIAMIVAIAKGGVIGADNDIPWYCPADLQYFKRTTMGAPVVMGRKTYESLKIQPLPGRRNIIISRNVDYQAAGCEIFTSIEAAIEQLAAVDKVFIIGGAELYKQMLTQAEELYVTQVELQVAGDRYFPEIAAEEWQLQSETAFAADEKNPHAMRFQCYQRRT
ncbi:MAG: dihydrofolate reductase [Gammaproteobacteria bacterium]|jgi:dihydrofolate reductase|nr:dihydrofolate reductase [Gammaproteobacteria bacterium]|tara:strand:+ start:13939 stop:14433 length:495 start_codon:yes stop_codon:yes gene_type:complete